MIQGSLIDKSANTFLYMYNMFIYLILDRLFLEKYVSVKLKSAKFRKSAFYGLLCYRLVMITVKYLMFLCLSFLIHKALKFGCLFICFVCSTRGLNA